jgi:hypothetical protein
MYWHAGAGGDRYCINRIDPENETFNIFKPTVSFINNLSNYKILNNYDISSKCGNHSDHLILK